MDSGHPLCSHPRPVPLWVSTLLPGWKECGVKKMAEVAFPLHLYEGRSISVTEAETGGEKQQLPIPAMGLCSICL